MSGNDQPVISLRNVGVSYWLKRSFFKRRKYWALKDVSFDLFEGDSLGVIGKNGVGKTTLLSLLAGVIEPDYGTIVNRGVRASLLALRLGFTPYLSGRENIILSAMFQGMTKKAVMSRLDEIITFAELDDFIDQPISTYSSGMAARLGFAVALHSGPDVLLVDEVLGVGDADFQRKSMAVMKERMQSRETTIVFVSHSSGLVAELCNRAVWIEDHVVQLDGESKRVLEAYESFLDTGAKPRTGQMPSEQAKPAGVPRVPVPRVPAGTAQTSAPPPALPDPEKLAKNGNFVKWTANGPLGWSAGGAPLRRGAEPHNGSVVVEYQPPAGQPQSMFGQGIPGLAQLLAPGMGVHVEMDVKCSEQDKVFLKLSMQANNGQWTDFRVPCPADGEWHRVALDWLPDGEQTQRPGKFGVGLQTENGAERLVFIANAEARIIAASQNAGSANNR